MKTCRIVGHRGWSARAPENTLAALRLAAGAGAEGAEFDVQRCRSGEVVLMHDRTVDRTTGGKGPVAGLTLAQLRRLDAGGWKDAAHAGEPVPTLGEALAALRGTKCAPVVEIKREGIAGPVAQAIAAARLDQGAAVIAFRRKVVQAVRRLAPALPCGWLCGASLPGTPAEQVAWIAAEAEKCGTDLVDLRYTMLSPEIIVGLHRRGLTVWTWTVNDPAVMAALLRWGVDGITTDRVAAALAVRRGLVAPR